MVDIWVAKSFSQLEKDCCEVDLLKKNEFYEKKTNIIKISNFIKNKSDEALQNFG